MKRAIPLNAIRVFIAAAQTASFKQAAALLFVTPGAVSRQIRLLEQYLGVELFERNHREVQLTQLGELYLSQVAPAFAAVEKATGHIAQLAQNPVVSVESTPTFAMHWLIPRLREFNALHPAIEVKLKTASGAVQHRRGIDLYIRRDPKQFSGLSGTPILAEQSLLVCQPQFFQHNPIHSPQDLLQCTLISMKSRPDLWPIWCERHGIKAHQVENVIELDNTIFAIQAATEGLGVAFIPRLFLAELLDSGALIEVPEFEEYSTGSYQVLGYQPGQVAVDTFVDWLRRHAVVD